MIIILHGPSGAGKTLAGEYLETLGIKKLVSHTTRRKRPGEISGEAYYFVNLETFDATPKIEESMYAGEHYGVSRAEVMEKYKDSWVFAVTDLHGVSAFLKAFKGDVLVIKIEASPRYIRKRMKKRGESRISIQHRMEIMMKEKRKKDGFLSDFTIYNNSSVKSFYKKIDSVLLKAKHKKFDKDI